MARVLIIEHNPDVRLLLKRMLTRGRHMVCSALNGVDAVGMAQRWNPDLIIVDLDLPACEGWATVRRIRTQQSTRAIPMIALTTQLHVHYQGERSNRGFDDLLGKPFDLDQLLERVRRLLQHTDRHNPADWPCA